jgi:hypothetical protein
LECWLLREKPRCWTLAEGRSGKLAKLCRGAPADARCGVLAAARGAFPAAARGGVLAKLRGLWWSCGVLFTIGRRWDSGILAGSACTGFACSGALGKRICRGGAIAWRGARWR